MIPIVYLQDDDQNTLLPQDDAHVVSRRLVDDRGRPRKLRFAFRFRQRRAPLDEILQIVVYNFSRPPLMFPADTESSTEFTKAVVSPAIGATGPLSLISAFS